MHDKRWRHEYSPAIRSMKTIAVIATMDTKAAEANLMREEIERLGSKALLIDIGLVGEPDTGVDITRGEVIEAGGSHLAELLTDPSRQEASPILIKGSTKILLNLIQEEKIHAVLALGGTQGTSNTSQVFQNLPYGFPKIILSTVASGDTSAFVGIKDITMMFSVSDILGLNPFSRKILANAAGAAHGMAQVERSIVVDEGSKGTIGLSNLGVLTQGAMHAIDLFHQAGYEVITFHAIGAGGLAMEEMMREGLITGVFDYALGEISDQLFDGLRAADDSRLTTAAGLKIPQVICPGGSEHIGLITEPNKVPALYTNHQHTFHNPVIFAPRLSIEQLDAVAEEIGKRLECATPEKTRFLIPEKGTSRYCIPGGELENAKEDTIYAEALAKHLPEHISYETLPYNAEDSKFVEHAVNVLIELMES